MEHLPQSAVGENEMRKQLAILPLVCFLSACAVISKFDQNSLDMATSLKTDTLALMVHGGEPFAQYAEQVRSLRSRLDSALAYENGKGTPNLMTRKQWELLISPNHLLGNFLKRWEAGETLSPVYIKGEMDMVGNTFDQIIQLEGGKIR